MEPKPEEHSIDYCLTAEIDHMREQEANPGRIAYCITWADQRIAFPHNVFVSDGHLLLEGLEPYIDSLLANGINLASIGINPKRI